MGRLVLDPRTAIPHYATIFVAFQTQHRYINRSMTSQNRLPPLDEPYAPEVEEDFTKLMPAGMEPLKLFKVLAHNPRVLRRIRRGGLLDPGSISTRQRELVILCTTALCGSDYEFGVHAALFGSQNFTQEELESLGSGRRDLFSKEEQTIVKLCEDLHEKAQLNSSTWNSLRAQYTPAQMIELVTLAGQYRTISYLTNTFEISQETWASGLLSASKDLASVNSSAEP